MFQSEGKQINDEQYEQILRSLSNLSEAAGLLSTLAIVISTFLAAMTLYILRKNHKQENALTILREQEADKDVIKDEADYRMLKNRLLAGNVTPSISDISEVLRKYGTEQEQFSDETEIIGRILNRFELIAAGIRTGVLDEVLIRTWMQKYTVMRGCELSKFISLRQEKSKVAFRELHWLIWLWSDVYPDLRRIIDTNLGPPEKYSVSKISALFRGVKNNWPIIVALVFQCAFAISVIMMVRSYHS